MREIQEALKSEILDEIISLGNAEIDSDDYDALIKGITQLSDRFVEMEKISNDVVDKEEKRKLDVLKHNSENSDRLDRLVLDQDRFEYEKETKILERDMQQRSFETDKLDQWIKNGIAVVGIVVPVCVTIWGTRASFKFEEEGTITTNVGRSFMSRLIPRK